MWFCLSFLVGVLVFGVEYFTYDIVIRDIVNILPHISIFGFFVIRFILKIFIVDYDAMSRLVSLMKVVETKYPEIKDITVEYKTVWVQELKFRFLKLGTIIGIACPYYFFFMNNKWLFDIFASSGIYF